MDYLSIVVNVIEEMGLIILDSKEDDFNIQDYIIDSMQFIDFIVRIENKIDRQLSDDFLDYELLRSSKSFALKISDYMSTILDNVQST